MSVITASHTFDSGDFLTEVYEGRGVWAVILTTLSPTEDIVETVLMTTGDHTQAIITFGETRREYR